MATTRLSQHGVGVAAYSRDVTVDCTVAQIRWRAWPALPELAFAFTRMSAMSIQTSAMPETDYNRTISCRAARYSWEGRRASVLQAVPIEATSASYTWNALPGGINLGITPTLITADYKWDGQQVLACGATQYGYPDSFNNFTWNTCTFNDDVFGVRSSGILHAKVAQYGWTAQVADVVYFPDTTVDCQVASYQWQKRNAAVSYGYDLACHEAEYRWSAYPASIDVNQWVTVSATTADLTWQPRPASFVYGYTLYCQASQYRWQAQPATITGIDTIIDCNRARMRWEAYPVTGSLLQLTPADIAAIADAVWQRMVSEGAVQQWLEVWQRISMDPAHPQTFRHPNNGGNIEVAGITIEQTEDENGDVRQHRQ